MTQSTDKLIANLSTQCTKVAPVRCVIQQTLLLLAVAAGLIALWVWLSPIKHIMWDNVSHTYVWTRVGLLAAIGSLALFGVFSYSLRGGNTLNSIGNALSQTIMAVVALCVTYHVVDACVHTESWQTWTYVNSYICALTIMGVSAGLGALALRYIKRVGTLVPVRAALMVGIFSSAFALMGRAVICPPINPAQLLTWHLAPALLMLGIVSALGYRYLKW